MLSMKQKQIVYSVKLTHIQRMWSMRASVSWSLKISISRRKSSWKKFRVKSRHASLTRRRSIRTRSKEPHSTTSSKSRWFCSTIRLESINNSKPKSRQAGKKYFSPKMIRGRFEERSKNLLQRLLRQIRTLSFSQDKLQKPITKFWHWKQNMRKVKRRLSLK